MHYLQINSAQFSSQTDTLNLLLALRPHFLSPHQQHPLCYIAYTRGRPLRKLVTQCYLTFSPMISHALYVYYVDDTCIYASVHYPYSSCGPCRKTLTIFWTDVRILCVCVHFTGIYLITFHTAYYQYDIYLKNNN